MSTTIISRFIGNSYNSEYFFSTNHCQPNLSEEWIPITFKTLSKEEVKVLNSEDVEIPNPDPNYQA